MSDNSETGRICAAAGDSCITEKSKTIETIEPEIAKSEIPKISNILETIPLEDKNTAAMPEIVKGGGDVIEVPVDKVAVAESEVHVLANGNEARLTNLQEEVQKKTYERDNFEKKLAETEKKLAALQAAYEAATAGKGDESSLRRELEETKINLNKSQAQLYESSRLLTNQGNQINALTKQVSSLKEVVGITKNLLEIRNSEVTHLQADVDSMENRITAERDRHNAMLRKMDAAVRLNADLKTEYQTQLRLFQDLRGKYEEKVTLLTAENNKSACGVEQNVVEPAVQ